MNKITQAFAMIALLLLSVVAVVPVNAALDPLGITVLDVKVDGDSLTDDQTIRTQFERDSKLEVKVQIQTDGTTTVEDVEVKAFITGTKDDIEDSTKPFDVKPNTVYTKELDLEIPQRADDRDYQLRVIVSSPNSDTISKVYPLLVDATDHAIAIKDVTFSPNTQIVAGRAFTTVARLKNYGQDDEQDIKVIVSVPELGIQEVDYINEIEKDETVSTEELLLRIPANTKSADYIVEVTALFDDYDEETSASYTIAIVGDAYAAAATGTGAGKTTITVGLQAQTVARGENGVIFPITLTNGANVAKSYTLTVSGASDWAITKISPSNVVILNAGETKQAYVYVAATEAASLGENVFTVDVKAGDQVVQQIPLKADVLESASATAWTGLKKALQVGIILLVVLIVVLGAVIVYQRRFKTDESKESSEEIAQTYY